ncbi:hypothetical protein WISP_06046 [Willisornis vidua]|uniref:D-aminoacyl-tRNA deacylase n=1 Tax=Willisornis vidua TaxID=1566151 RepID=A0ABQ9DT10_9PASS|nr:hypothetical protein WISP_06046 [Willisornis vidua]
MCVGGLYQELEKSCRPLKLVSPGASVWESQDLWSKTGQTQLLDKSRLYGKFGAYMQVHIQNDGPVTIELESPAATVDLKQGSSLVAAGDEFTTEHNLREGVILHPGDVSCLVQLLISSAWPRYW